MSEPLPMDSESAAAQNFWDDLRRATQARIGLGRAGDALPTRRQLEFGAAHAAARDAVHVPLELKSLMAQVVSIGLGEPLHIHSRAADRSEYLRRPDLGRVPDQAALARLPDTGADIAVILADGLSARAVQRHGAPMLAALKEEMAERYSLAPPIIATQSRVALGDHVGEALGVQTVLILIGERPGLSVADSLGIYLTHHPTPGRTDAERNCVSNIHPPQGLTYTAAARVTAALLAGARRLGRSGIALKDTSLVAPALQPGRIQAVDAER